MEGSLEGLPNRIHEVIDPHVAATPDHLALMDDRVTLTYRELDQAVSGAADALRALGIRPGDRMMIVSENSVPLACLLLAASRLDAWAIVVNPRLSARELDQIRDHSGARRVFLTADVSPEAAAHAARYEAAAQDLGPLAGIAVTALNASTVAEPVEADGADQVAVLIYTSGTTGTPKGVMLTHRNLLFSARGTAGFRRMDADDVQYCVLPISHIVGISLLTMTLMVGAAVRLVPKYDPAALVKAMAEEGITILNGVPATYQRLLEYRRNAGLPKLARGRLRLISVAGAPLDLDLKSRVETELGLPLLNGYGITECSPGISGVRPDSPRADHAVGTVMPGIEARLVGRDLKPVAAGEVGELHVRGPNVMRGYYRAPDQTAKAIDADGWFNTGDLARFENDALYIVGRTKEMIIRSGFNVYPAEIEAVLSTHDAVVQCAVVGRPVEGNEEIVAFVQLIRGSAATAEDLMAHIAPQLTSYKRPSEIILMDALPATSTGKLLKHKLAEFLRGRS
ncbi:AMP-binding protein [Bradyrhizobium sp. U87765 SZCCT0131]|nr:MULTISPECIES: AMP-binding protein [unclassified Bradyrhizobium]MBR1220643.1 AMP-binding protein [Bradyrhizobium sp. U87765 SZCCT0131]MBR1262903.1 AMP-binding protein [Bradyrhizobium sp. U87765 SZCCT0134]MBR1307215.1 AMP-binding protein [Bradyrhizobium sp. U87765 SZCCT0110]MBR1322898.1 AMP-binding protein [Bradyrhizobium sp. U87765 SZCCT0109]MBR1346169.1 AMP-binding protein [Bradyrhizobium sp. U87765 SZCCT0048]